MQPGIKRGIPSHVLQGESLPLWGTVGQITDQLTAAGVGQRPTVFVCHRCTPPRVMSWTCIAEDAVLAVHDPNLLGVCPNTSSGATVVSWGAAMPHVQHDPAARRMSPYGCRCM